MKRRDQSDWSYEAEKISGITAQTTEATFKHENLHDKRKNNHFTQLQHGRPRNVPFELCPKPRKKCLLRSVAYGTMFCMAETPCWKVET